MRTLILTLFLFFSIFAACAVYAGNNTITASYPAPSGAYNKVVLENLSNSVTVQCSQSNVGLIFMDNTTKTLQLCAYNNGNPVQVPFGETCFNRFCSWTDGNATDLPGQGNAYCQYLSTTSPGGFYGCPAGYAWAPVQSGQYEDIVTTSGSSGTYYHVESAVCCNYNSVVLPPSS